MASTVPTPRPYITRLTNCRLAKGDSLVMQDLYVNSATGKIVDGQKLFYSEQVVPEQSVDLGGRIVSPGLIDVQLNGAFGFDFSSIPDNMTSYGHMLKKINRRLVQTGVTSYLPTLPSQRSEVYHKALPFLGPSGIQRRASDGAESLGAHCEGPFLAPTKNGAHNVSVLQSATSFVDLESCYGADNLNLLASESPPQSKDKKSLPRIKMITAAPEVGRMSNIIPEINSRGIIFAIGHTEASYETATLSISKGASMITHLFNAMQPLHHRNPGVFGVLGTTEPIARPYFGVIADGVHLHPATIKIAYNTHPEGLILVTDAMHLAGLKDGVYKWTNGDNIIKCGPRLTLEGSDKIAGSSITLMECVNNLLNWSGGSIPQALKAVTLTPAAMLGISGVKGSLETDADADLVILSEELGGNGKKLVVDQVWKFGRKVFDRDEEVSV